MQQRTIFFSSLALLLAGIAPALAETTLEKVARTATLTPGVPLTLYVVTDQLGGRFPGEALRAIEFGVHQKDVFAVCDGAGNDVRGVVDGSGHFEDRFDFLGLDQQPPVFGDRRLAPRDRRAQPVLRFDRTRCGLTSLDIGAASRFEMTIGDGNHTYSGRGGRDLERDAAAHKACAHHAHADGVARGRPLFKCLVHDNHAPWVSRGQCAIG